MKLTIRERVEITNLFPQHHDIMTQVLVEDISKKVKLSQEEIEMIGLKRKITLDNVQLSWDETKTKDIDIRFSKTELQFLKRQVLQYDDQKKITQGMLSVCLKLQAVTIENEEK